MFLPESNKGGEEKAPPSGQCACHNPFSVIHPVGIWGTYIPTHDTFFKSLGLGVELHGRSCSHLTLLTTRPRGWLSEILGHWRSHDAFLLSKTQEKIGHGFSNNPVVFVKGLTQCWP